MNLENRVKRLERMIQSTGFDHVSVIAKENDGSFTVYRGGNRHGGYDTETVAIQACHKYADDPVVIIIDL